MNPPTLPTTSWQPDCPLSIREREIVELLMQSMTTWEVSKALSITPKTVDNHRTNIYRKLGISHMVQLVRAFDRWTNESHFNKMTLPALTEVCAKHDIVLVPGKRYRAMQALMGVTP